MKRFLCKDKIKEYTLEEMYSVCGFTFDYCISKFGINKRKRTEIMFTIEDEEVDDCMGYYDVEDNEIFIILTQCRTIRDVVATMIHEYTHSLQPCRTHYTRLFKKFGYDNHPYEIEAKASEVFVGEVLRLYRKTL